MRFFLVLVSISAVVGACGDHHGDGHARDHGEAAHAPAGEDVGPRLDGDAKWQMDDHTRSMLGAMVSRVEAHAGGAEAARELGSELQQDIKELIRGCTMTGEAHAELHKFLVAYMPAVDELAARGGEEQVHAVNELLDSYPRYFQ